MRWLASFLVLVALGLAAWFAFEASRVVSIDDHATHSSSGTAETVPAVAPREVPVDRAEVPVRAPAVPPISVTVVDTDIGAPIARASVRLAQSVEREGRWANLEWFGDAIETDASGTASLADATPTCFVVAMKDGYVTLAIAIESGVTRIAMTKASTLFGRVLDAATRDPIGGAVVSLEKDDEPELLRPHCVSDAHGAYRLDGLRPRGNLMLRVQIDAFIPVIRPVFVENAGEHELDIVISFKSTLRGQVVDAMSGGPIEGAGVRSLFGGDDDLTRTDSAGRFTLRGVSPSQVTISVRKHGYLGSRLSGRGNTLDLSRERVFPMVRECRMEGEVVDSEGKPVEGAGVTCYSAWGDQSGRWRTQIRVIADPDIELPVADDGGHWGATDAAGRFVIDTRRPWAAYTFAVRDPIGRAVSRGPMEFDAPGEVRTVRFAVSRGSVVIHGRVLLDGKPPTGTVRWKHTDAASNAAIDGEAIIESDGSFRCTRVVAGTTQLTVRIPGSPRICENADLGNIADGASIEHNFTLITNPRRIDGIASNAADERPLVRVALIAERTDLQTVDSPKIRISTATDASGRFGFDLPDAPGSQWWIQAADSTQWSGGASAVAGSNDVVLRVIRANP